MTGHVTHEKTVEMKMSSDYVLFARWRILHRFETLRILPFGTPRGAVKEALAGDADPQVGALVLRVDLPDDSQAKFTHYPRA